MTNELEWDRLDKEAKELIKFWQCHKVEDDKLNHHFNFLLGNLFRRHQSEKQTVKMWLKQGKAPYLYYLKQDIMNASIFIDALKYNPQGIMKVKKQ